MCHVDVEGLFTEIHKILAFYSSSILAQPELVWLLEIKGSSKENVI